MYVPRHQPSSADPIATWSWHCLTGEVRSQNHRKSKTRFVSYSDDDGLHWSGFAPVPALTDPGCKGGIAAWPAQKALLFTNDASWDPKTHAPAGRVNITLRVSTDDGA